MIKNSITYCGDITRITSIITAPDQPDVMEATPYKIDRIGQLVQRGSRPATVYIEGFDDAGEWTQETQRFNGKELS